MLLSISVRVCVSLESHGLEKGIAPVRRKKNRKTIKRIKCVFSGNDSQLSHLIFLFSKHLMVFFRCRCWAVGLLEQKHDSMGHRTAGTQARQGIRHFMLPLVHWRKHNPFGLSYGWLLHVSRSSQNWWSPSGSFHETKASFSSKTLEKTKDQLSPAVPSPCFMDFHGRIPTPRRTGPRTRSYCSHPDCHS